jgi:hypothetical protein
MLNNHCHRVTAQLQLNNNNNNNYYYYNYYYYYYIETVNNNLRWRKYVWSVTLSVLRLELWLYFPLLCMLASSFEWDRKRQKQLFMLLMHFTARRNAELAVVGINKVAASN